ncbi:MAG: GGDEF domain-containing protein [Candidatus Limnocylindrales bacterium]
MLTGATEKPDASAAQKDRRLRAVYRRELQDSVLFSALAVTAGIAVTTVIACLVAPSVALAEIALATPLVLTGLDVSRTVTRRCRRYAVQLGMLVGLLPFLSTAATTTLIPQTEPIALGSLGVMPLAFAVFIPLERKQHLIWLMLANAIFFGVVGVFARDVSWWGETPALAFTAALAFGLSLGANEIQLRRRQQMNRQLLAVRGLYGRMKEHEVDLRRQDEFLFMQQETLVVQQAELLRLNEELESIARLDALTGLGNRLRLNEDLAQTAARIERSGGTVGLLLMDLDRFKRLNDSMGHLAGDAALRGVADVLRKTSRLGDGLYRYGGEEFLVVLHDCDEAALEAAGQRYITAVAAAAMLHPDNPPWNLVTASAGARELSQRNCTDIDSALHDADEALYVAKASGRNRLEIHSGPTAGSIVPIDQQRAAS